MVNRSHRLPFFNSIAILLFVAALTAFSAESTNGLLQARQLLLVRTAGWTNVPGELQRFERKDVKSPWRRVGKTIPVVVGRNGLGWSDDLKIHKPGPRKKEGDGKSPAGIFKLGTAFGLAEEIGGLKIPYLPLRDVIECVDDVKSIHYNSIVNRERVAKIDWDSSEKMKAIGEQYRLGVSVLHNTTPMRPGGGSCIFLHIWKNSATGTSGCTAMSATQMQELIHWLDATKNPTLVQIPQSEFGAWQTEYNLPK